MSHTEELRKEIIVLIKEIGQQTLIPNLFIIEYDELVKRLRGNTKLANKVLAWLREHNMIKDHQYIFKQKKIGNHMLSTRKELYYVEINE
jgi:hypothetical protein